MVGELVFDGANLHCLLLLMFLNLPFAISLSTALTFLCVWDWNSSPWRQVELCGLALNMPPGRQAVCL